MVSDVYMYLSRDVGRVQQRSRRCISVGYKYMGEFRRCKKGYSKGCSGVTETNRR